MTVRVTLQLEYKIEIDRNGCIACATCYTIDPLHFESDSEGKSKVVGGVSNGESTGSFDDSDIETAQMAARSCPVSVINVIRSVNSTTVPSPDSRLVPAK